MNKLALIKQYGIKNLILRYLESKDTRRLSEDYLKHIEQYLPTEAELEEQRGTRFAYEPLVSIVVPTYETPRGFFFEMVDSVLAQTYGNFELILADGSATDSIREYLKAYEDSRIRYVKLSANLGISQNTNEGLSHATGEYLSFLDHDDLLTPNALFEMVAKLNETALPAELVYSDEDKLNMATGTLGDPAFKPDYNEYFLRHNNYICHFVIFSRNLYEKVKGLDPQYDGAQDHAFLLSCKANGAKFAHVSKILYHWRIHPMSTAADPSSKLYAYENGRKAIADYLENIHAPANVTLSQDYGIYRIDYELQKPARILVLTHSTKQLRKLQAKQKPNALVDITYLLESDVKERMEEDFDYYVILHPNVCNVTTNWVIELLKVAQQEKVALASAKCIAGNHVVSCGYTYDDKGYSVSMFKGLYKNYHGYHHRAIDMAENISLDPLYCTMLRADAYKRYRELETLDQAAALLCEELRRLGTQLVVCTYVVANLRREPEPLVFSNEGKVADVFYSPNVSIRQGNFNIE